MKTLFVLLFFLATAGYAATNQIDFTYGRGTPSSHVSVGQSFEAEGSRGTDWSLDALHLISPRLYLGMGSGRFSSSDNVSLRFVPNTATTLSSKVTSTLVLGRVDLASSGNSALYVLAGAGWVKNTLTITAVPSAPWPDTRTSEVRTLINESENALGYTAGAGLDLALTERVLIGIEGRYQGSPTRRFDLTPEGASATGVTSVSAPINRITVSLKAGFRY